MSIISSSRTEEDNNNENVGATPKTANHLITTGISKQERNPILLSWSSSSAFPISCRIRPDDVFKFHNHPISVEFPTTESNSQTAKQSATNQSKVPILDWIIYRQECHYCYYYDCAQLHTCLDVVESSGGVRTVVVVVWIFSSRLFPPLLGTFSCPPLEIENVPLPPCILISWSSCRPFLLP